MSLQLPTDDAFRPDRPGEIDPSRRAIASALVHADAGYPVVPLHPGTKEVPEGRGRMRAGTTDADQILRWWQGPPRDVGIVLDGLGLAIIDVDGPKGEESLARLAGPGGMAGFPPTYEVATTRGRHLYFRTPVGFAKAWRTQNGHHHDRPELDIKLTWMMVVPGSASNTGHLYQASWDHIPLVEELPVVPESVWSSVAARAVNRTPGGAGPSDRALERTASPSVRVLWGEGRSVALDGASGARLQRLLADVSDHRDGRVFEVVLSLLRHGAAEQDVWATLVNNPLGDKIRCQSDPVGYFQHKVESARGYLDEGSPRWDREGWLRRALRSGLGDAEVRVMTYLCSEARPTGVVSIGSNKIGYGSALSSSQAGVAVDRLLDFGSLELLREHDRKQRRPRTFRLTLPEASQNPDTVSRDAPPLFPLSNRVRELTRLTGHDAFRSANGCLGKQFRALALVADGVGTKADLQQVLGCDAQTIRRHLKRLVSARLISEGDSVYALTPNAMLPLLDEVATKAGTKGVGKAQWAKYLAMCERDAETCRRMATVGTEEWRRVQIKDIVTYLQQEEHLRQYALLTEQEGFSITGLAQMLVRAREASYEATEFCFRDFDSGEVA